MNFKILGQTFNGEIHIPSTIPSIRKVKQSVLTVGCHASLHKTMCLALKHYVLPHFHLRLMLINHD